MYSDSPRVSRDDQEALRWWRLAAAQGNADAQFSLGSWTLFGHGLPQNVQKAAYWFRLAANQGHADAQFQLGALYSTGQGVPKDYVLAYMWVNLGAANGALGLAAMTRDFLEKELTLAQLAEAQRLAREWKPKGE